MGKRKEGSCCRVLASTRVASNSRRMGHTASRLYERKDDKRHQQRRKATVFRGWGRKRVNGLQRASLSVERRERASAGCSEGLEGTERENNLKAELNFFFLRVFPSGIGRRTMAEWRCIKESRLVGEASIVSVFPRPVPSLLLLPPVLLLSRSAVVLSPVSLLFLLLLLFSFSSIPFLSASCTFSFFPSLL